MHPTPSASLNLESGEGEMIPKFCSGPGAFHKSLYGLNHVTAPPVEAYIAAMAIP